MNVSAIGAGYQSQIKISAQAIDKEQQKPVDASQINKLNAEIKQAEAEIEETMKEVQKATVESSDGASDKAQMLQSKILMQQQLIMSRQMQVKEIESPEKYLTEKASAATYARPKFDQYIAGSEETNDPDNVYRLEEKEGVRQIIFNRPEE